MADAVPLSPRSSGVVVRWRPDFAYYEQRIAILRALRDQRLLRQFRVDEQEITARLSDTCQMVVSAVQLAVTESNGSLFGSAVVSAAMDTAISLVDPVWEGGDFVATYVAPLDTDDYDDARLSAAGRFWADGLADSLGLTDWAMLCDGRGPTASLTYQLEFGIVSRAEAATRVLRRYPRVSGPPLWTDTSIAFEFPAVGLFADVHWFAKDSGRDAESLKDWLGVQMAEIPDRSADLVGRLQARMIGKTLTTESVQEMEQP
jgi:hypothetical protein